MPHLLPLIAAWAVVVEGEDLCKLEKTVPVALAALRELPAELRVEVATSTSGVTLSLVEKGRRVLVRALPAPSCVALSESIALIADRYLDALAPEGEAPDLLEPPLVWKAEAAGDVFVDSGVSDGVRLGAQISLGAAGDPWRVGVRAGVTLPVAHDLTRSGRVVGAASLWLAFLEARAGYCLLTFCGHVAGGIERAAASSEGARIAHPGDASELSPRGSAWLAWHGLDPLEVSLGLTVRPNPPGFFVEGAQEVVGPAALSGFLAVGARVIFF